jgi:hypothetical protein
MIVKIYKFIQLIVTYFGELVYFLKRCMGIGWIISMTIFYMDNVQVTRTKFGILGKFGWNVHDINMELKCNTC